MSIRIDGTNTTANPGITGSDTDTGLQFGTNEVNIVTDGTDRVTVTSSGDVRVPAGSFDLRVGDNIDSNAGTQTISVGSVSSGSGGIGVFANPTNGNSFIQFGDGSASADQYRGYVNYQHANDSLSFGTAGSERMRILSGGGVTFNGDTATANALDDYEEGTWTPVWQTTGTAFSSVTYTDQIGFYTKIGNLVHVSVRLKSTASSGGTGLLLIGGLPFQISDSTGAGGGSPSTYYIDYHNSTLNVATETRDNSSQFYLLSSTDNGDWNNVSASGIQGSGTSEVRVSFFYKTNS